MKDCMSRHRTLLSRKSRVRSTVVVVLVAAFAVAAAADAATRNGVVFADAVLLDKVAADSSLKPLLAQDPPQSLSALLPEVEDSVRALDSRQLLGVRNTLRRLAREQGIYIYLWTGEHPDLPRKMAETSKYVRERPIAAEVAVVLLADGASGSALLFSDALVSKRGLVALQNVADEVPDRDGLGAGFGAAVVAFLDAFERNVISRNVETAELPMRADRLQQDNTAGDEPVPESANGNGAALGSVAEALSEALPVDGLGLPTGQLAGAADTTAGESSQLQQPDPRLWGTSMPGGPIQPVEDSRVKQVPTAPPGEENAKVDAQDVPTGFKLDRAGKLFVVSIALVFVPVLWTGVTRFRNWLRERRAQHLPARPDLGRPSGPLLSAAQHRRTEPSGPRMHPIEQKVQLSPRRPFRGSGSQKK